ncbi:MAG TPA: rhodanese-like domain-containing protein [Verrucomicrobiales bacterium]|nr:rhodanese-like domain-containing protein [Verrucomicrobiales bacterium]
MSRWPSSDTLEILPQAVAELRTEKEAFTFIDCREEEEWNLCRIGGAVLMPLSRFAEIARQRFIDPEERVVIYCHHGMRSAQAAMFLRQLGMNRVWSLAGGIDAWSAEIDPNVRRY